jgi:hypothetical protein
MAECCSSWFVSYSSLIIPFTVNEPYSVSGPLDATQADIEQLPLPGYSGSPFPGLIVALFSGEAAQSNLVSPLDLSGTPYTIVFVGGLGEVPTDPMARLLSAVNTGPSDDWYMGSLGVSGAMTAPVLINSRTYVHCRANKAWRDAAACKSARPPPWYQTCCRCGR